MEQIEEPNEIVTTHKLDFEVAPWEYDGNYLRFRVGTCVGLFAGIASAYGILAINNSEPGNGHLNDVLEWFEHSCKRDGKSLHILDVWNLDFKKHLIEKRGFVDIGENNVEKTFIKFLTETTHDSN